MLAMLRNQYNFSLGRTKKGKSYWGAFRLRCVIVMSVLIDLVFYDLIPFFSFEVLHNNTIFLSYHKTGYQTLYSSLDILNTKSSEYQTRFTILKYLLTIFNKV